MKITFAKEEFLEKLYSAMATVSNKSTIASIEGVLLETMEDGTTLRMTTYDMSKGIRSYIENIKVDESGKYIINAARLLQIMKVMPSQSDVTIEVDEKLSVKIHSGKSSFSLFAMDGAQFPTLPELAGEKGFSLESGVLKRIISKIIHSISQQDSRPALTGAYFTIREDSLEVVSCDSYTLSKCSVKCKIDDIGQKYSLNESLIIPGHALNELLRLLGDNDNQVKIYLGIKHAIFHIDDIIFFTRLIDGEYFDYRRIIPKEQTIFITLNRERLLEGLERAILVAEEKYAGTGRSYVKLTVGEESLTITSSSSSGKVYDEMNCLHSGDTLEIGFNCRFLINSVKAADSEDVIISMKSATQSITIEPAEKKEESDFFYLVLPVRMGE